MRIAGLRARRERALLTQRELAAKAGITAATLNRLERGLREPQITTVRKLAAALGIAPQELLAADEPTAS